MNLTHRTWSQLPQNAKNLQFYVSTNPATKYDLDIYRLGYYGGTGGNSVVVTCLA